MRTIADFHIHSKYSRATSPSIDLESLDRWAITKGVKVLGTGDFTHPEWLKNLKDKLEPAEPGLFNLKNINSATRFLLTAEISCIYTKGGKIRKIHIVVFAPSFGAVDKINAKLNQIGNLRADGRPILGLDAKELAKIVLDADENCMVVPAHLMTPWFSVFGSRSGFDSIEECFEDYTKYIYAGETGLSANPKMLWRMSDGRRITLISNSDAHSAQKIGREANIFDTDVNYFSIIEAIKEKDKSKFLYTIEFFPEEGKYHYDGHKDCNLRLSPKESKKYNNICPICAKHLVIGVLNRVEKLADRPENFMPESAIPFKSLIPLQEIIAESLGVTVASKQVDKFYNKLTENLGNEFGILLEVERIDLEKYSLPEIAEGIIRVRNGKVEIEPGYDGVYGKIKIFSRSPLNQKSLF
ncbi:MAG: endonuclease Q family protein [Patescibacteria group bacterium]